MGRAEVREQIVAAYRAARGRYLAASQELVDLLSAQGELRVALDGLESSLAGMEAGWIRDGALEGLNNELYRRAKMQTLRDETPAYRAATERRDAAKRQLTADVEAHLERLKMELRLCRYDMEMSIGEMRELAGQEGEQHGR